MARHDIEEEYVPTLLASDANARPADAGYDEKSKADDDYLDDKGLDDDREKNIPPSTDSDDTPLPADVDERVEFSPHGAYKLDYSGDQSPFPEVAACVSLEDDESDRVNHFRMWFLLHIFVILFGCANTFFGQRWPSLNLHYEVAQLLVFPIGKAWERWVPHWRIGFGRLSFDLNPGKFNKKEHTVILCCVSVTLNLYRSSLVTVWSPKFFGLKWSAGWGFLWLLTSTGLGFGLAGMTRRWLVYPGNMIWPKTLASAVLMRALHEENNFKGKVHGWGLSRYKFFLVFVLFSFILFWFPGYIATSLSSFAFLTWIFPNNQKINTIFGTKTGLGLLPISLDWTMFNYVGSPLSTPFYINANWFFNIALFYLVIAPILYYKDVWFSGHLPMLSSGIFDNTGAPYNVSRVLNPITNRFNETGYHEYSPIYLSMSYTLSYALSFAAVASVFVYTVLYNGKEIISRLRSDDRETEDVHKRMMNKYVNVPDWWYLVLDVVMLGAGIFLVRYWPSDLPIYAFLLCWVFGLLLIIPQGLLEGVSNTRVYFQIFADLIAGYAFPGKPLANLYIDCFGNQLVKVALDFSTDMKLGQYMKVPPRTLFFAQAYSVVLAAASQTGVLRWMLGHIDDFCGPNQAGHFICPSARVRYNSTIIWGVIGPARLFGPQSVYRHLYWFFLIGPAITILVWLAWRRWPNSFLAKVNIPLLFNSAGWIPPATTTMYSLTFILGFLFNFVIRKRYFSWWKRYNYLLQAAMDTGVALAIIIIFFGLTYNGVKLNWALNTVGTKNMDAKGTPAFKVAKGSHFGRGPGEF
ncbi:hypothetical protein Q8F55_004807 [Vanrija albida]|uniref:OPT family small oligopeptide transporter n=1 Tax=Vanrija albida TaxID=181172 RepID=A0ABR3PZX9_9TREE